VKGLLGGPDPETIGPDGQDFDARRKLLVMRHAEVGDHRLVRLDGQALRKVTAMAVEKRCSAWKAPGS
jgi:hypothetical protein